MAAVPQCSHWDETPSSRSGSWQKGSWCHTSYLSPLAKVSRHTHTPPLPGSAACSLPATGPQRQRSGGRTIGKAGGEVALGGAEVGCLSTSGPPLPRAKGLGVALQPSPICQASSDPFHPSSGAGRTEQPAGRVKLQGGVEPQQGKGRNPTQVTMAP